MENDWKQRRTGQGKILLEANTTTEQSSSHIHIVYTISEMDPYSRAEYRERTCEL